MPSLNSELAYKEGETIVGEIKKRTPVNQGQLRENWHSNVLIRSGIYEIIVSNNTEYASYVENGFRAHFVPGYWAGTNFIYVKYSPSSPNKYRGMFVGKKTTGWQKGKFMMRKGTSFYKNNLMVSHIQRFWQSKFKQYLG